MQEVISLARKGRTMATTRINFLTHSLASVFILSLLFIIVSASEVSQQKPNPGNNYDNKNVNANSTANAKPTMSSTTKANVFARKIKSAKFVKDFVTAHNMVRLPFGHEPLKWNYTLAYYAKQWAKKRINDCKLIHSYGPYGENLFWGGRTHWTPIDVVKSWVEEKAFYDPNSNSCAKGEMCGHYTQVIWKDTVSVGCARVICKNNKGLYVICSYDPPGNYINEHPLGNLAKAVGTLLEKAKLPLPKPSLVAKLPPLLPVPRLI